MNSEPGSSTYPRMEVVKTRVITSLSEFYKHDHELLTRNASERSITHKLGEHLQKEFPDWHVDCEYNRREGDPKRLVLNFSTIRADDTDAKTVFPDIIVHQRGIQVNLLVIEVKKEDGEEDTHDEEKLRAFGRNPGFGYRYGLFLRLGPDGCSDAKFYETGERKGDWVDEIRNSLEGFRRDR